MMERDLALPTGALRAHGSSAEDAVQAALTALLNTYEKPLFNFLVTFLNDRDAAADCLQDTFLRAYVHLSRGNVVPVAWLYKVARNRAIDHFRARKRERTDRDAVAEELPVEGGLSVRALDVRAALARLSPDDREILYLAEVEGFTSIEIGEMLGARPGAIRMRLVRAHARFRAAYGENS